MGNNLLIKKEITDDLYIGRPYTLADNMTS